MIQTSVITQWIFSGFFVLESNSDFDRFEGWKIIQDYHIKVFDSM
jgi:hypothetical protein